MKTKIVPKAFKQHFPEPNEAQGIDPEVVSSYMKTFYGGEATTYPAPPYNREKTQQITKANKEALAICDQMEAMGFSNFSGLRNKFRGDPQNEFEANQRDLIKKTMEGILYTFETTVAPLKDVLVAQYKDRQFVCADGTLTNLQSILADLSLGNQGIGAYVTQQGRDYVTQVATEMYKRNEFQEFGIVSSRYVGYEIHDITSLVSSVAPEYGIKAKTREEDHYLSTIYSSSRKKLSSALEQGLQNEETVANFVDGIARNVALGLPTYTKGKYVQANEFTQEVSDAIERLNINHIISTGALVKLENYEPTGYKPNIESILKDATTIYLHEKGVLQIPEKDLELTKLRIDLEKSVDEMSSHNAITKDVLDAAKGKGNLEYAMKYAIDNKLTLDEDSLGKENPMEYAIDNNIKIDGIDPKQYALKMVVDEYIKADAKDRPKLEEQYKELLEKIEKEGPPDKSEKTAKQYVLEKIIDQYLKTDDPVLQNNLKEKYAAAQKLGEEQAPKLLNMDSNLGQFLNNPKAPEILANHKDFKGKSALTTDVDYTKCDLDVIKKCKEVHEKTSKARDYDTLSTAQKVGVAFSTVVPIIGNAIAYYAMKSHNKSEKAKLESTIGQPLEGIKGDLDSLSKKPKQPVGVKLGDRDRLQQIRESVSGHTASKTSSPVGMSDSRRNSSKSPIID